MPPQSVPAQDYPSRPVKIIVPFGAGGPADVFSRQLAQYLTEKLKQSFVVEDRPGAGSIIGTDAVAKSPPDGYTLLAMSNTHTTNESLIPNKPFQLMRDFAPVTPINYSDLVMVVHPSVPAKDLKELIALAKAKPGGLNYASSGPGTPYHMAGELFKAMAGVNIVHVPYKGAAPALMDVIAGQIQVAFSSTATGTPHIKSGKVRGLAVTSPRRSPVFPDLPTVSEAGVPGFELHNSYAYFAPDGTPRGIIRAIHSAVSEGMAAPDTVKALTADGSEIMARDSPEEFKARFDREYAELEKLIKSVRIKID